MIASTTWDLWSFQLCGTFGHFCFVRSLSSLIHGKLVGSATWTLIATADHLCYLEPWSPQLVHFQVSAFQACALPSPRFFRFPLFSIPSFQAVAHSSICPVRLLHFWYSLLPSSSLRCWFEIRLPTLYMRLTSAAHSLGLASSKGGDKKDSKTSFFNFFVNQPQIYAQC